MLMWHHKQTWHSLSQQYAMLSASNTHSILLESMILDFWTRNFQATVISLFAVQMALKMHNVI